jgi:hypothetical protein
MDFARSATFRAESDAGFGLCLQGTMPLFVPFAPFCGLKCVDANERVNDIAAVSFTVVRIAGGFGCRGAVCFLFTTHGVPHYGCELGQGFSPGAMVFVGRSLLRRGREERLPTGFSDSELPPSVPMDFNALSDRY